MVLEHDDGTLYTATYHQLVTSFFNKREWEAKYSTILGLVSQHSNSNRPIVLVVPPKPKAFHDISSRHTFLDGPSNFWGHNSEGSDTICTASHGTKAVTWKVNLILSDYYKILEGCLEILMVQDQYSFIPSSCSGTISSGQNLQYAYRYYNYWYCI